MGAAQSILTPSNRASTQVPQPAFEAVNAHIRNNQDTVLQAPPGYVTPTWPGLYRPTWIVRHSNGNGTDVLPGNFLFEAIDIWHYTLYWHIVLHGLIFVFPALWCTFVLLSSPTSSLSLRKRLSNRNSSRTADLKEMSSYYGESENIQIDEDGPPSSDGMRRRKGPQSGVVGVTANGETIQLSTIQTHEMESSQGHAPTSDGSQEDAASWREPPLQSRNYSTRARKSAPMYLAFVPLAILLFWCVASALVMSTIIGFVLAAVYNTTGFEMSTWVPFLWGCIEASIVVITSWSTFTTIL